MEIQPKALKITTNVFFGHRNEYVNYLFAPASTPSVFSVTWKQQKAES